MLNFQISNFFHFYCESKCLRIRKIFSLPPKINPGDLPQQLLRRTKFPRESPYHCILFSKVAALLKALFKKDSVMGNFLKLYSTR